jgi:biotin transport system substrate-specific component
MTTATPTLAWQVTPRTRVTTAVAVVAVALLTAVAAQIRFPLPFTPVPITGQTFVVVLGGAVLGMRAGAASQLLYLALGAVGLPVFTEASGGWQVFQGATGGYLVGFVFAAALVGWLAEQRYDRRFTTAVWLFALGNLVIYAFGVPWLMVVTGWGLAEALAKGVLPFLVGDLLKIAAAAGLTPAAWRLLGRDDR